MSFLRRYKAEYILAVVIIFNVAFPVVNLGWWAELSFYLAFNVLRLVGTVLFAPRRLFVGLATLSASLAFALGVANTLLPFNPLQSIGWGVVLVIHEGLLILVLLNYIFTARHVTRSVLLSGVAVYLLFGTIFVPIYTQAALFIPNAFAYSSALGDAQTVSTLWARFLYFSFITLTTAGYGDITPTSGLTQALAVSEAVIGVLYVAIFMARLVGVYAAGVRDHDS